MLLAGVVGAQRVIVIVGVGRCEGWKRAPMKPFAGATVTMGHGGARCDGSKERPMKEVGWQRVEKETPMKPFSVV